MFYKVVHSDEWSSVSYNLKYELIFKFYEDKYNIIGQVHGVMQQTNWNCKIMHNIIKTCTRREYEFV